MRPFRDLRRNSRSIPQIPNLIPLLGSSKKFQSKTHILEVAPPAPQKAPSMSTIRRHIPSPTARSQIPAKWDALVTEFLESVATLGVDAAIEQCLQVFFQAEKVIYWQEVTGLELLQARSASVSTGHTQGLAGFCFTTRHAALVPDATKHDHFSADTDGKLITNSSSVLLCPVTDCMSIISGVVEVVRAKPFEQEDLEALEWFAQKMRVLSRFVGHENQNAFTVSIVSLSKQPDGQSLMFQKMAEFFECDSVEVWRYSKEGQTLVKFTATEKTGVDPKEGGIAMDAIRTDYPVNETGNGSRLAVPVSDDKFAFAIVLEGSAYGMFGREDVKKVKETGFHIAVCVENLDFIDASRKKRRSLMHVRDSLNELLGGVELLCSELELNNLLRLIIDQGRQVVDADRCAVVLFTEGDEKGMRYVTKHGELEAIPEVIHGLGREANISRRPVNEPDAHECSLFDIETDEEPGYRTKAFLCVPIFSPRNERLGFIELRNKKGDEPFLQWDVTIVLAFCVFCGIAIENAKLYKESVAMSKKIHNLVGTAMSLSKSEDVRHILSEVVAHAKRAIGADRVSVFMLDDSKETLTSFIVDGSNIPTRLVLMKGLAGRVVRTKECVIENNCYANPDFDWEIDESTGYRTNKLLVVPITNSNDEVIGVIELLNKLNGDFDKNDLELLSVFITFASVVFENSQLREKIKGVEGQIEQYIKPEERSVPCIPVSLCLTDAQIATVNSMDCFAYDFKGVDHFKECFYFFQSFDLLRKFEITSEQFYRFIYTVSERYTSTPYHNWTHACDVLQCVFFQLKTASVDTIYEAWEIFTLLVAAICHDTNHEGLNNVFNVRAETPLGILFKGQSVMETHHITECIPIINRADINLFGHFDNNEVKLVWKLFIQLILATDMAHHFNLVTRATAACDEGSFNFKDPELRLLGLQLLLKVADVSNVARPFYIANQWCDILNEEFFHQGDLEKETIGLTSPMNDRDSSDKPKSQIGFYNGVCGPLLGVVARIYPALEVNVNQLKENQACWQKMADQEGA